LNPDRSLNLDESVNHYQPDFSSHFTIDFGALRLIVDRNETKLDWASSVTDELREELLQGPVRGLELHVRGSLVLHGSCLDANGSVVSIIGPSGAGKSTVSSMLCNRGAKLVSDGMTPVHPETLEVASGPPRTKLNDESIRLLGQDPIRYQLVHPQSTKRYFPVPSVNGSKAVAPEVNGVTSDSNTPPQRGDSPLLRLILIIEDAEKTEIAPIPGAESLIKLIKNIYLVEYFPPEHSPIVMQRTAALIQHGVLVKALHRKKDPRCLVETVEAIEREVARLA
jgi:hypothetical protein